MPLDLLVGGAVAAHSLWSYNRENYMWEGVNKQALAFQMQTIMLSRHGLFREDIRDLAGLTTSRMSSYLVINTLKLGFIVQFLYSYDRTDKPMDDSISIQENQFKLLYTMCFLTSFAFLITSIWLSMHASIVVQSFMTKMLLETVRIPIPEDNEVRGLMPQADLYELDLPTAFRVPGLSKGPRRSTLTHVTSGVSSDPAEAPVGHASPASVAPRVGRRPVEGIELQTIDRQPSSPVDTEGSGAGASAAPAAPASAPSGPAAGKVSVAAHVKFYNLVMAKWLPLDLYSRILMSIGTSALCSGMAYMYVSYQRELTSDTDYVRAHKESWIAFIGFSVLAWLSVRLDLTLSRLEQAVMAVLALGGPIVAVATSWSGGGAAALAPLGVLLQAAWVWLLCASALAPWGKLPRRWPTLHVLGEVSTRRGGRAPREFLAEDAVLLLRCVDAALAACEDLGGEPSPPPAELQVLQTARTELAEALLCGGASFMSDADNLASQHPEDGFLLQRPDGSVLWVSCPGCGGSPAVGAGEEAVACEELAEVARRLARALLQAGAAEWTARDAGRLAAYGGARWRLQSFESHFHAKDVARSGQGSLAQRFYHLNAGFVSTAWAVAVMSCFWGATKLHPHQAAGPLAVPRAAALAAAAAEPELARVGTPAALELPEGFAPASMTCSPDGHRFAIANGSHAFMTAPNGSAWLGPFAAAGPGGGASAAAFGPGGELLLAGAAGDVRPAAPWLQPLAASSPAPAGGRRHGAFNARGGALALSALALDAAPGLRPGGPEGLGVRGGRLVALEPSGDGEPRRWRVAGALPAAAAQRWRAVALHGGRALALAEGGALFELDAASGAWAGPWRLHARRGAWRGLCAGGEGGAPRLLLRWRQAPGPPGSAQPRLEADIRHFARPTAPAIDEAAAAWAVELEGS